jgi:hypothetical protein
MVFTTIIMFYNTEWQQFSRMAVNYHGKKFYNIGHWCQCYQTFCGHKLLMVVISYSVCPWQTLPAKSDVCGKTIGSCLKKHYGFVMHRICSKLVCLFIQDSVCPSYCVCPRQKTTFWYSPIDIALPLLLMQGSLKHKLHRWVLCCQVLLCCRSANCCHWPT